MIGVVLTVAVVGISLTAYAGYRGTVGRIHHVTLPTVGPGGPPSYNSAENVLVIGAYNDVKDYTSATFKPSADNGADTYVLVHITPNHKGGVMISFPRDSMVPVYACPRSGPFQGQQAQPGSLEPLNQTYSEGGPGCAWKTIEKQTGIRIAHFIEVDYLGFEKFVGAIGGANVCVPYAVNVPNDGLRLPAGRQHIDAKQALQFVRARDIGQWSDLQRIKRQQFFMISVMQSALHQGLLGNPVKLYQIAHAVAPYLVTDSGFGLTAMYHLARSMQGANLSKIQLIEVPVAPYPQNTNRVVWRKPQATQLFAAVAHDRQVSQATAKPTPSASPTPTVPPGQVHVDVLNGNGVAGIAGRTSRELTSEGFDVVRTGDASSYTHPVTLVEYSGKADLPAAATLQRQLSGAQLKQVPGLAPGVVTLIIGKNFAAPGATPTPSASAPPVKGLAQSYHGVTGNANICHDQSAFSG